MEGDKDYTFIGDTLRQIDSRKYARHYGGYNVVLKTFYDNGNLKTRNIYVHDNYLERFIFYEKYYKCGKICTLSHCSTSPDKKNIQYNYYPNDTLHYFNIKNFAGINGHFIKWYDNGRLREITMYSNGKRIENSHKRKVWNTKGKLVIH